MIMLAHTSNSVSLIGAVVQQKSGAKEAQQSTFRWYRAQDVDKSVERQQVTSTAFTMIKHKDDPGTTPNYVDLLSSIFLCCLRP
jgi:hypothetical protein